MALFLNSILILIISIFFISCADKPSFTPEKANIQEKTIPFIFNNKKIEKIEHNQVKLSDGSLFDRNNSSIKNKVNLENLKDEIVFSQKDNLVAYISENNSVSLFDIEKNSTIFQEPFPQTSIIDRRLPKPLFDKNNILYFTLDGKIAIFSIEKKQIVRVISIDENDDFSNVIDYKLSENSIILVTHRKLMMITDYSDESINLNLRGSIFGKENIFLVTKDGEIRKYDYKLNLIKSIKYPFAYFVSFGKVDNNIYLIESQGYVIELNSDLESYRVISSELDDENCFFTNEKFICDEKTFKIPLSI